VAWTWRLWRKGEKLMERQGHARVAAGGQAAVPVSFAFPKRVRAGERLRLTAVFDFADGVTQVDEIALYAVMPSQPPQLSAPVHLLDPHGLTARLFDRLGVRYVLFDGTNAPVADDALVVIGREALDGSAVSWMSRLDKGLRVLVFEQRAETLERGLGFRVAERGVRRLFPRAEHPVTRGLDEAAFRDWTGSGTLVTPYLTGLPAAETHDPHGTWCGFTNTRVWRCGSRGTVASVLIEKPARGDWRALLDGEFDLQYAALLEHVQGRGRALFCQLDVTGRTENDPAADRLVANLLEYLDRAPAAAFRETVVLGAEAERLAGQLGVVRSRPPDAGRMFVVSPGASAPPPDLFRAIEGGVNVVCLGLAGDELKAWCPVPVATVRTNAAFTRIEQRPPELDGLSNADWAWHGRITFDALAVPEAEKAASSGALRVIRHGKGRVVLWQVPPWLIDEQAKPYLRTSKRRANAMAARLLANLGAALDAPVAERFAKVEEKEWLMSYYLDTPEAGDDPYRYYRW